MKYFMNSLLIVGLIMGTAVFVTSPPAAGAQSVQNLNRPARIKTKIGPVPLTKSECTALGGVVGDNSQACTAKGQFTCTTTTITATGTVNSNQACIDK